MSDEPLSQEDIDAALADLAGGASDTSDASAPPAGEPSESVSPDEGGEGEDSAAVVGASAETADAVAGAETASAGDAAEASEELDSSGRPFDEVAAAMAAAIEDEKSETASEPAPLPPGATPAPLPSFDEGQQTSAFQAIDLLRDVSLQVKIELGRCRMLVEDVLRLAEGSVVELDKLAGDPVDVFVNDRLVARGEVLVLNDSFCVRVNEIVSELGPKVQTA